MRRYLVVMMILALLTSAAYMTTAPFFSAPDAVAWGTGGDEDGDYDGDYDGGDDGGDDGGGDDGGGGDEGD